MRNTTFWILWMCLCYSEVFTYYYEEDTGPIYLTAAVGDHVVFHCDLNFPHDIPIPYVLKWNKEVGGLNQG